MWNIDDRELERGLKSDREVTLHLQPIACGLRWVTGTLTLRNLQRVFTPDGIFIEGDVVACEETWTLDINPIDTDTSAVDISDRVHLRVVDPRPDFALLGLTYLVRT